MSGVLGRMYRAETKIDFLGKRRLWFAISAAALLLSAGSLAVRQLHFGIEFEGGVQIQALVPEDGPLGDSSSEEVTAEMRDTVSAFDVGEAQIQVAEGGEGRVVLVQTKEITEQEQRDQLLNAVADATGTDIEDIAFEAIGSKWGGEITEAALRALIVFILVVTAFISWRFEWKMAVSAVAALFHDLLFTAGVYSLVGFEVTPSTVVAILTILGYSLYDNVVVFDKVEEDTAAMATTGKTTYQDAANQAMNEVFMRSLNTGLTTMLPVGALLVVGAGLLGASTLKDLALALFVGLLVGAYSSLFFATPILAMMKEREPRYRNVRERVLRDARRRTEAPAEEVEEAEVTERLPAGVGGRAPETAKPAARPRAGTKKARRRRKR